MTTPKTCSTCAHRVGPGFSYARCAVSGLFVEVARKHPTHCDRDFSAWQPRPGLLTRVIQFVAGVKA